MIAYYIIIFVVFLFALLEQYFKKNKKAIVSSLFVFLVVSLSFSISRGDYYSYYYYFEDIDLYNPNPTMELGFFYFSYAIKIFTEDSFYLFFWSCTVCLWLKFLALKKFNANSGTKFNYGYFFCLYLSSFLVYLEIGSIRFSMGVSFFLLALTYLLNRDTRKYTILVLIGVFFHASLIVALIIPAVYYKKQNIFFLITCCISGILLSITFNNSYIQGLLMSNYYLSKLVGYSRYGSAIVTFQLIKRIVLIFLFYLAYHRDISKRHPMISLIWTISVFSLSIWWLFIFSQVTISRYLLAFGIFEPLILMLIYRKITFPSKYLYLCFIFLYIISSITYGLERNSNDVNLYLPYKNIIFGDEQPYQSRKTMYFFKEGR